MAQFDTLNDVFGQAEPTLQPQAKKGSGFSKRIVVISILLALGYTCVVLYFSWLNIHVPAELTASFFSFIGIELGALAWRTGKERVEQIKRYPK